ncbi:hypothetical protein SCB49_03869 [unidentified eubacterium SCB49]|nr:hypothetical protein SCB49_03869 [unidentified eubacterium SCB49]
MSSVFSIQSQSIAREWNEAVLVGIRNDYARPTVHARNLYHSSILMYDVWALFDDEAETFFLGKQAGDFFCEFEGFTPVESVVESRRKAMSYAVYRLMKHRFEKSPRVEVIFENMETLMEHENYDTNYLSVNYQTGDAAALGNYMAQQMIAFGLQDGANEINDYANTFYEPVNDELNTDIAGNDLLEFPNRWQPLKIENFVDQSGNSIPGDTPPFLSPEWGFVTPFSLTTDDLSIKERDGDAYWVYNSIGTPSYIKEGLGIDDPYKWGFSMVAVWGAHLGPENEKMIDISPRSIGNVDYFPNTFEEYKEYYDFIEGGDPSLGRALNPVTNQPYEPQIVKRSDYARVLAEFWADGPDSETPPGHWFTILNYVSDHPGLVKKYKGEGEVLSDLEWDVKSYFSLGGAMHDSAIAAWSNKGYYDYIRPISAIRYMSFKGQSTDPSLPRFDPHGIPLIEGYIELVDENDPLVGAFQENLNKIKLYTWLGPDQIIEPTTDVAGVGWLLAEEWFPYQRASFVTPPFAGYVSGHSTYSRAAAEVLTRLTGSEYFPGGMGIFEIKQNDFLVFEMGPTEDMQLQWATYRDASDQTSLSRIWGGIHPAIDDIPGRIIGEKVGNQAFDFAERYFFGGLQVEPVVFPNPVEDELTVLYHQKSPVQISIYDTSGRRISRIEGDFGLDSSMKLDVSTLSRGVYFISIENEKGKNIEALRFLKR